MESTTTRVSTATTISGDGTTRTSTEGPHVESSGMTEKPDPLEQNYRHKTPEKQIDRESVPPPIDHEAEARLLRKLDLFIVPPVMLLYLLSFLDRVNIGNARLYGMETDLGLHGDQFQTAVSLLFVTYILSELPSNLVIKQLRPSRWISFLATSWGIIATLTGLCRNYGGLIVCRLFLGAVEGGLFPGMTIYLTLFYTKRELALRVGYLFVSAALAGALGGLLAYGIGFLDGVDGQRGWRWIMFIEGLCTFPVGVATWWWLADEPETAYYLSAEEKALMHTRKIRQIGYSTSADHFHQEDMMKAFKDWRVWAICIGQFGSDNVLYGFSTFLPTIIKGLGKWTTAQTQALTIPCYALGAITYLSVAKLSDSQQRRGAYTVLFGVVCVVGYGVLISDSSAGVHYFGCFLVSTGLYVVVGIPLSWLPASALLRHLSRRVQLTHSQISHVMVRERRQLACSLPLATCRASCRHTYTRRRKRPDIFLGTR